MDAWSTRKRFPRFLRIREVILTAWVLSTLTGPWSAVAVETKSPKTGSVNGHVLSPTGDPLSDASVEVVGTNLSTSTDVSGFYRLALVPAGEHSLTVSYLGYQQKSFTLTLAAGETHERNVTLAFGELVTVHSSRLLSGQAKALNQQKNAINITNVVAADQIGRFPDPNAAEAAQRIPGITLQRSQGEGRYVLIRGTGARFSSTTINGERVPSPESEGQRRVPLDLVPADLLQAIEIAKSLTPDMDGDAIGGRVNLVTRRAPENLRLSATVAGGYNEIVEDSITNASFAFGRRFGDDKALGLLWTGSFLDTDRGSDNIEPEYDGGFLDTLELRDYIVERRRAGWTGSLDHRPSDRLDLFLRGIGNAFDDDEIRRRKRQRVARNRIDRNLRHRPRSQTIASATGGGSYLLGTSLLIDTRLTWSRSTEDIRNRTDSTFTQRNVQFDSNVSPGFVDPDNIRANPRNEDIGEFLLDGLESRNTAAHEEDVTARVDFTIPFYLSDHRSGTWKAGAKLRTKERESDTDRFGIAADNISLAEVRDDFTSETPFLAGRYDLGPFQDPATMRRLVGMFERRKDVETDLEDSASDEDILAAYGLVELNLGSLTFLGGLRSESTKTVSEAFELIDGNDFLTPVRSANNYGELLPMIHLRYRLSRASNLRAAVTRTLARPDFSELVPTLLENLEDQERERGNPDLSVTSAWNIDFLYERFLAPVGIVSFGVFYKQIEDNIFTFKFEEHDQGLVFDVEQPRNGESSEILGIELAFQNRLHHLPEPFDGLGLYINYTYSDSEAMFFPGRAGTRLTEQAEHVGNFALSYEQGRFSGRLSFNYHSEYLREVGPIPERDTFEDEHLQIDCSASHRLTDRLRVFLELVNLGDEPLRRYEGSKDRPIQEEVYGWWGTVGLKWDL